MKMIDQIRDLLTEPGRLTKFLDATGLHREASKIAEMLRMDSPWPYTRDNDLNVENAGILRSGSSRYFFMESQPRGRAIVFATTNGLNDEVDRWKSIFEQLGFEYDSYRNATCSQIRDVLLGVSYQRFDGDALIVMFIGAGYMDKVCGYGDNEISITEIVDIFSDINCVSLRNKPKIFIFNSCRMGAYLLLHNLYIIIAYLKIQYNL
jgi:hypothetical protein